MAQPQPALVLCPVPSLGMIDGTIIFGDLYNTLW